jgi:hypothetical protein
MRIAAGQQDGSCAITEQRSYFLVKGIYDPTVAVTTDHQSESAISRRDILSRRYQSVDKPRTGCVQIHGRGVDSEFVLHEIRRRGTLKIRCKRANDNQIDVPNINAAIPDGATRGFDA